MRQTGREAEIDDVELAKGLLAGWQKKQTGDSDKGFVRGDIEANLSGQELLLNLKCLSFFFSVIHHSGHNQPQFPASTSQLLAWC